MWVPISLLSLKNFKYGKFRQTIERGLTFRQTIERGFTPKLVRDTIITYDFTFKFKLS